jgi:hypothetical protein
MAEQACWQRVQKPSQQSPPTESRLGSKSAQDLVLNGKANGKCRTVGVFWRPIVSIDTKGRASVTLEKDLQVRSGIGGVPAGK